MIRSRIKNNKRNDRVMKFALFLYICTCLLLIVWLRAAVINLEYEIGEIDKKRAELISQRERVFAQRASFYSAENIEKLAIKHLGMTMPERENIFFVKMIPDAGPYRTSGE
jgi:cell division protein FtsL